MVKLISRIITGSLVFTVIIFFSMRTSVRIDFTDNKIYSIGSDTKVFLSKLQDPVRIIFAYDLTNRFHKDVVNVLKLYERASDLITLKTFDPVIEPSLAEKYDVRFAGTSIFKSGKNVVQVDDPSEEAFTNALINVTSRLKGKICFTDGHVESNPFSLQSHDHSENSDHGHNHSQGGRALTLHERHGMGMSRKSLEVLGYSVAQIKLLNLDENLMHCDLFIIASPQTPFDKREINRLQKFLKSGIPALFMLEPNSKTDLSIILNEYGLAKGTEKLIDKDNHYWVDPYSPAVTNYPRHRMMREMPLTFFPGVVEIARLPIRKKSLRLTPLVVTSDRSLEAGDNNSKPRSRTIAFLVKKNMENLIVFGDGDFATNSFFGIAGNAKLFLASVGELMSHYNVVSIEPRHYTENNVALTKQQIKLIFLVSTGLGPVALFLIGCFVLIRRKS